MQLRHHYVIISAQRRQSNGQVQVTKGCSDIPQLTYDDGSMLTQLNTCATKYGSFQTIAWARNQSISPFRNTNTGSSYNAMICNTNYCNAFCTPGGDPQRGIR